MFKAIIFCITLTFFIPLDGLAANNTVATIAPYDDNNIFAKILRKEAPATIVFENEYVLAFEDIHPMKPVHILVIPKGKYRSMLDFSEKASDIEITAIIRALGSIASKMNIDQDGFSIMSNSGHNGGQTVPHLHFHLLGGEKVAWEESLRKQKKG